MAWKKLQPPTVPSLEKYSSSMAKRFTDICITNLVSHRREWIKKKMDELNISDMKTAVEFGIKQVGYPLTYGQPDDLHVWNAYHGKNCYKVTEDYWDSCSDVMMEVILCKKTGCTPLADCDGSSEFITGMLRILSIETWEVFGEVYKNNTLLGGHAYLYAKFPDNTYRLIESTLDKCPTWYSGYPQINPETNKWKIGNITYVGDFKFNETEFYEWSEETNMEYEKYNKHIKMKRKDRERKAKYDAIREAFNIPTKAHRNRRLLARLRWRK